MAPVDNNRPIVFSGPSGTGKSTLIKRLFADHPDLFGFSVSHTTRKPRPGEEEGVHYHFVSKEDMEAKIARNEFVEYAHVHTNIYGTSKESVRNVQAKNKVCILDIDTQGAKSVKADKDFEARFIFISPPS